MKRTMALILASCLLLSCFAGCTSQGGQTQSPPPSESQGQTPASNPPEKRDVDLAFFTGKVETVDLIDGIIAEFNVQSGGVTVEQEYQNDASNIIKIKFASGEAPDVMTTYEQEYVDQGKYLDLSGMNEWWDRLIPSMKENCTDIASGKQYRVCTNMTMAGFFYNKEMFDDLKLTPAKTWEEFVANLEAIKAAYPDVDPWFIFGSEAWHLGHLIEFIPHGYIKAKYGATEAKKAMLSNDKAVLNFGAPDGAMATFAAGLLELQQKGLINADVLTATSDNCVDAFVSGKTAMLSNGMWCLSGILEKDPAMADKIGFAPYPAMMADVPVLLYHSIVEEPGSYLEVSPETFDAQMRFLAENGYHAVTTQELINYVYHGGELPDKPVLISFDDGYQNNYDYAWPILREHGLKATIYAIGVSVGHDRYKDTQFEMTPHFGFEEARRMVESGVIDVQSHTYDMHQWPPFESGDRIRQTMAPLEGEDYDGYAAALSGDVAAYNQIAKKELGYEFTSLAFPGGDYTTLTEVLVHQAGIPVTMSTRTDSRNVLVRGLPQSLYALSRWSVTEETTQADLLELLNG